MSCFQQQKTAMNDVKCLESALKTLGFKPTVSEELKGVRGHYGETQKANVIVSKEELKTGGDIGFKKEKDGSYIAIADTYVVNKSGFTLAGFVKQVTSAYAVEKAKKIAKQHGLEFRGTKTLTNGHTRLQFAYLGQ